MDSYTRRGQGVAEVPDRDIRRDAEHHSYG